MENEWKGRGREGDRREQEGERGKEGGKTNASKYQFWQQRFPGGYGTRQKQLLSVIESMYPELQNVRQIRLTDLCGLVILFITCDGCKVNADEGQGITQKYVMWPLIHSSFCFTNEVTVHKQSTVFKTYHIFNTLHTNTQKYLSCLCMYMQLSKKGKTRQSCFFLI